MSPAEENFEKPWRLESKWNHIAGGQKKQRKVQVKARLPSNYYGGKSNCKNIQVQRQHTQKRTWRFRANCQNN